MKTGDTSASIGSHSLGNAVEYLPLVQRVVRRLGRRLPPHVTLEDLLGAGVIGLLESMQRFDPSRATEFSAYAEMRIRGAILDELRRGDLMARDARTEAKRIEQMMSQLMQRLKRPPTDEEVAEALHIDLPTLHQKLEKLAPVRLKSFDDMDGAWFASATLSPFENAARAQTRERLVAAITQLSERQQQVLHLYYQEELTLREIGVVLEVTESRVCQIMAAATLSLRASLRIGPKHG